MDEDLERMSREQLIAEAKKLRDGIRAHRDSTSHELCWHHPAVWGLLPDRTDPLQTIYGWRRHFGTLDPADIKRLRQLEGENGRLKKMVATATSRSMY